VIVDNVKKNTSSSYGFDASAEKYVDMIEAGIIDPTKVTRHALLNASSVSALMLTTSVMITDLPEESKEMPGMPPGGMGGMGGGMGGMY
jgi:chaperonin GroEL